MRCASYDKKHGPKGVGASEVWQYTNINTLFTLFPLKLYFQDLKRTASLNMKLIGYMEKNGEIKRNTKGLYLAP